MTSAERSASQANQSASQASASASASATSASNAETKAAEATAKYTAILNAMQSLPDGSAVSAQVALNKADIDTIKKKIISNEYTLTPEAYRITNGGAWQVGSLTSNSHACISVAGGDVIFVDAQDTHEVSMSFLTSNVVDASAKPSFCSGYSTPIIIPSGTKGRVVIVPSDCLFVSFNIYSTGTNIAPERVYGVCWAETVEDALKSLEGVQLKDEDVTLVEAPYRITTTPTQWQSDGTHALVSVSGGNIFRIIANDNKPTSYAFLTKEKTSYAVEFVEGYDKVFSISSGESREVEIPEGCRFLYIYMSYNNVERFEPKSVTLLSKFTATEIASNKYTLEMYNSIVSQNEQELSMICSLNKQVAGNNEKKLFTFIQMTDSHADTDILLPRMVEMLNTKFGIENVDMAINTGDTRGVSYVSPEPITFGGDISKSNVPVFIALGNHDTSGMSRGSDAIANSYNTYIKPMVDKGWLTLGVEIQANQTYYYKDFASTKTRLVVINDYEKLYSSFCDDFPSAFDTHRVYSQSQIDFLVNTLMGVPNGYSVIVAKHSCLYPFIVDNKDWGNSKDGYESRTYMDGNVIEEILSAYRQKSSINKAYQYTESILKTKYPNGVSVNADFSTANGVLSFVVSGHEHEDSIGHWQGDEGLKNIIASADGHFNTYGYHEYGRTRGYGKSQDLLNAYVIDNVNRIIHLVRIGANFTIDGKWRTYTTVSY